MALLSRFFGRTASEGAAFAFGLATGPVLSPAVEELKNEAWSHYTSRRLDAGTASNIVAEDVEQADWGAGEAAAHGYSRDRFDALLGEALNAPGIGQLFELWRRGVIDDAAFAHGLRKSKLEPRWDAPLRALHDVLLTPETLANARQQGFVDVDRQHSESALQGVTQDRADVLFELSGNPPGPEFLERAANRGFIDRPAFEQGIREGRTKTKYTDLYWRMRNPLLSAATAVRLYLKGWYTQEQRDALGAQWGYTSEQMNDWYLSEGRPATSHQIHIGYARGAKLPGATDEVDAIRTSVKQSDIRPEYADLIVAQRYTYPPFFALRTLAQGNVISEAEMRQVLLFEGWEPTLAEKVAAFYAKPAATVATENPYVAKADNQLWTALHKAYVKTGAARAAVEPILTVLIPAAGPRDVVFARWDEERQAQSLPAVTA